MRALLTTAAGICLLSAGALAQTSSPPAPSLTTMPAAQPATGTNAGSTSTATPSSSLGITEGRQESAPNDRQAQSSQNWNDRNGDDNDDDENRSSAGNDDNDNQRGWGPHPGWRMHDRGPSGRMGWGMGGRGERMMHGGMMRGQMFGGRMMGPGAFFAFRSPHGGFMVRCERGEQMKACVDAIMPLVNKLESMKGAVDDGKSGGEDNSNDTNK
jgi:hypothetical protein